MELEEIAEGAGTEPLLESPAAHEQHPADPAPDWVDAYEF